MATFPTFSQKGGPQLWIVWGGGITNHEVFTFTNQSVELGVGAFVSDVAAFQGINMEVKQGGSTIILDDMQCYAMTLTVEFFDDFGNLRTGGTVTGNFESTGI